MKKKSLRHFFPTLDGVGPSCVQVPPGSWPDVLHFLCERFPAVGEATWRARFARQRVLDAAGQPLQPDSSCRTGDRIHYYRELPNEVAVPFHEQILYQDAHLLVADKPHFLPVTPVGRFVQETLLVRLKRRTGLPDLSPIHRLDKDTAGLVLFSANPATRDAYQALFRRREVHKTYHAIARLPAHASWPQTRCSRLEEDAVFFRSRETSGEPNSETRIQLLRTQGPLGLFALQPVTGRKHQLRVHMAALGAPILHDPLYPDVQAVADDDFRHPLQLLAQALAFTDPVTGEARAFESRQALQL